MNKIATMIIGILVLIVVLLLIFSNKNNTKIVEAKHITMEEALEILNSNESYILVDVRRPEEYKEGHIPGAINIPNETINNSEVKELPDKNQMILVYCRSGNRSKQATTKLEKLGYTNLIEIGGILDWKGKLEKGLN